MTAGSGCGPVVPSQSAVAWLCPRGSHLCSKRSSSAAGLDFNSAADGWDDTGIMREQMEVPGDEVINLSGREAVWGAQPGIFIPVCSQHNNKIRAQGGEVTGASLGASPGMPISAGGGVQSCCLRFCGGLAELFLSSLISKTAEITT